MRRTHALSIVVTVLIVSLVGKASAAMIVSPLGNILSGFTNGDILTAAQIGTAQSGQPVPFDKGYGTDGLFGGNFNQGYTHLFAAITDTILSATLTIGIADHDSAAPGSQLAQFLVDGTDATTPMDAQFETLGTGQQTQAGTEFNIYSIDLLAAGVPIASLADGSVPIALALQDPGLVWALFPMPGLQETTTNGANLIFSTLEIETQDAPPTNGAIPEPSSVAVWSLLGVTILTFRRRRRSGTQP